MITRIVIKDVATFDASEHIMQDLGNSGCYRPFGALDKRIRNVRGAYQM